MKRCLHGTLLLLGCALSGAGLAQGQAPALGELRRVDPRSDPFQILRQKPDAENPVLIPRLIQDANRLPPPYLYELARRLWSADREQAFEWYAVGMIRARYDALRCVDASSHQGILMLPMAAPNVSDGIAQHRAAFGEAGKRALARADLFSSAVSPMWICMHGMAAVNSALQKKPLRAEDTFTPEPSWPALREKLREDYARYFDEQGKPQNDPIPMAGTEYRRLAIPNGTSGAWLNARQVVFTSTITGADGKAASALSLWTIDGAVQEIAPLKGFWCAGNDVISYQAGVERLEQGQQRISYISGLPGKWTESSIVLRAPFLAAQMVQTAAIGWSLPANAARQSPFDCRWVASERLSGEKNSTSWMPLLPGHGFVQFPVPASRERKLRYWATEDAAPVDLPFDVANLTLESFRFFAYRDAYFVSPVGTRPRGNQPEPKCVSVWWLWPRSGRAEEACLPVDSVNGSNAVLFAPSKAGWLRATSQRNTAHGPKTGGLYLTKPDGTVEKVLESRVASVNVAPDGCSVAVQHHDGSGQKLDVLNLCRQ